MIRKGAAAAAIVMAGAMFAWGQAPASQPATQPAAANLNADKIAGLIAEMGSREFQARQRAQKALVQIGIPAEPALRDAVAHSTSAEIRSRAQAAIDRIEDNLPDSPSRVSVRAVNEDPGRALRAMAEQAGVSIVSEDPGMQAGNEGQFKPITLDLDRVPLLVALEKFCKATHTRPFCNGGGPASQATLQLIGGETGAWDQEDRVAIVANQIGHDREIDLSNNSANRRDFVTMSFYFDPKRQLIGYQQPQIKVAVDETGTSLVASPQIADNSQVNMGEDGFDNNPFMSRWGFDTQVPLNFPAHTGKTLARLEGTVTIRVATKIDKLDIPDLAKAVGTAVTAGDRKVEIVAFSFNGNTASLHVRVSNTAAPNAIVRLFNRRNRSPNLFNEFSKAAIRDASSVDLSPNGGGGSGTQGGIDWQGQFIAPNQQPLKGPISLHWNVITETKDIPVPFKFQNLPLPPQ
ncbi:MAG TPA: hypothetical protein VHY37_03470 [Tepidisphaeraceae bacterium]|jgi:hypothetical protein|nr:hypothetical protein [Tepidisphaeraceae bacterium]